MREGVRAKRAWSTYAPAGSANPLQGLAGNGRSALGVVALPSRGLHQNKTRREGGRKDVLESREERRSRPKQSMLDMRGEL